MAAAEGKIQAQWGDLRDDEMQVAEGNTGHLVGKLRERYGWDRDLASTEVSESGRSVGNERRGRSSSATQHPTGPAGPLSRVH